MNRPIPGYYYDAEKKKYFKIEKSHTAPVGAAWSAENVKRRKVEAREERQTRRRQQLTKAHIRRSRTLCEPLMGGLLDRSLGISPRGTADITPAVWTAGLVEKGHVPFVPSFARPRFPNIPCFYVGGGDEKTGLGVAYASLDEESLIGSYIPTDDNDKIQFMTNNHGRPERRFSHRHEMIRCPQMSSIKYHPPTHRVLLTSREPDSTCGVYFFSPPLSSPDDERPHWLLGETDHYQRVSIRNNFRYEWVVNQSTPAPAASDLICTIGTNSGILQLHGDERIDWVTPKDAHWEGPSPTDIFDQDFLINNHNVLLAGGRQGSLWIMDLRTPVSTCEFIPYNSAITHLRAINEHQILVAGLRNSMAVYDIRYRRTLPNGTKPLLTFPEYKNLAHIHIGWDLDITRQVVAAAHDDGKVALYSLNSGRRLRSPVLDKIATPNPIKSMMFQTMPRNRHPSLFVGIGPSLEKYSFGTLEEADES